MYLGQIILLSVLFTSEVANLTCEKSQNSQRWYLLERTSRRFFVMLVVVVVFLLHWRFFISFFSTSSLTLPWSIAGFLHPFYTFSPAHRRVIRDTFILTFLCFFTASATEFERRFLPQAFFTLHSLLTFF